MPRNSEKLLLAALAGLVITCAAAFAVSPTLAGDSPSVSIEWRDF